jgi:hypothetical protein
MSGRRPDAIYKFVLKRTGDYTGEPAQEIEDRFLYRDLRIEAWDFVELCEELELTYRINLKPFFEDGQPTKGRLFWKQKVARDVTVRELAEHVESLAAPEAFASYGSRPRADGL